MVTPRLRSTVQLVTTKIAIEEKGEYTMSESFKETKYWKSLDQWKNSSTYQELVDKEFIDSPLSEESQGGWARRDFLKLMGASLALGSFGCVRRPIQKIVPYVDAPEGLVPGVSNFYASSFSEAGEVLGLVVNTREGKPIKLEGNEYFPEIGQALSARGQAKLLSLYDPARISGPIKNLLNKKRTNKDTVKTSWDTVDMEMDDILKKGGVYVISGENSSETSNEVIDSFVSKYGGKYLKWSPSSYSDFKDSFTSAYGEETKTLPRFRISKSKYILSIGTDFLQDSFGTLQMQREWGKKRDPQGSQVELDQVESLLSLTGTNADHRLMTHTSKYLSFLCAVISNLGSDSAYAKKASSYSGVKDLTEDEKKFASEAAKKLKKYKGEAIVMAYGLGSKDENYLELQKAAHFINSFLGNDGKTIDHSQAPYVSYNASSKAIDVLLSDVKKGLVKTLFIHDINLFYKYAGAGLEETLKKVDKLIYTGDRNDETGGVCHYVLPDDHALEKWSEFESVKGVYAVSQPTIAPLYKTRSFEDSALKWMGSETDWFETLKNKWKKRYNARKTQTGFSTFEEFWVALLQKGVWDLTEFKNSEKTSRTFIGSFNGKYKKPSGPTLTVFTTSGVSDGTLSNVSWMQEFPDPVTKIVWDNYYSVSMDFAEKNKLSEGDMLNVTHNNTTLKLPVHIQPGQDTQTIGVGTGYGRKGGGKVCEGLGQNAYKFTTESGQFSNVDCSFEKTGETYILANVQGHHSMEGRAIVNEASFKEHKKDPSAGIHRHKVISLWSKHKYDGHKWGMSVDLSKCTGCSACVVACQSENNIPVVGRKHVLNGREMHWIRIDRYYVGDPNKPRTVHQPVMCQHCDNAPCETVCPVLATVHSSEGTNDMVYNRCVGTRYCANNCPYKVRRFNWFNYSKVESPLNMALNPNVTVRSRGVMEKCTFCVHKIQSGKSTAKLEGRKLKDGEVKPACELTCPTKAITFGDMNNEESKVTKKFKDKRTYMLLEELNVVPAVRYMTKLWNTDSEIAGAGHGSHEKDDHKDGESKHKKDNGHTNEEAHS